METMACICEDRLILMEGAMGIRLRDEFGLLLREPLVMADLVYQTKGRAALHSLWSQYGAIARKYSLPFLATTPTRRANRERVKQAGYTESIFDENISVLKQVRAELSIEMYIGGLLGCRGNAYAVDEVLPVEQSYEFHSWQAEQLARAGADFLMAGIMPALSEAVGIAQAMEETGLPYLMSLMIRPNGCLLDGTSIHEAITEIDNQTKRQPAGYMVNCVHPSILFRALSAPVNQTSKVRERFIGIQANASALSPEELDGAQQIHTSAPEELAQDMLHLHRQMGLRLFGGCCGTDERHLEMIAKTLTQAEKETGRA